MDLDQINVRAAEVLARCERVNVPIADAPRERAAGLCPCNRLPDIMISLRLDGVEMFWALACPGHHDQELQITFS